MSKVHDRVIRIGVTADEGDDTVVGTYIYYYRNRAHITDSDPETITASFGAAAATTEITLGQMLPPPTHIQIASTFQA